MLIIVALVIRGWSSLAWGLACLATEGNKVEEKGNKEEEEDIPASGARHHWNAQGWLMLTTEWQLDAQTLINLHRLYKLFGKDIVQCIPYKFYR